MDFAHHLDALIIKLKTLRKDPKSARFFDHLSGAFIWSDERLFGLNKEEMGCLRGIFKHRTNLIVRENDLRFESLWIELKRKYPDWIGFDPDRCNSREDLVLEYHKIQKAPLDLK